MSRNVADMQKFEIWEKFSSLQPDQQGICDLWLEFFNFSRPNHGHGEFVICYWIFCNSEDSTIGLCDWDLLFVIIKTSREEFVIRIEET